VEKRIFHNQANNVEIKETFEGGPFGEFEVRVKLEFPVGCISEDMDVYISCDTETGVITALPHTVFIEPIELEYRVEGLYLEATDENLIDFAYMSQDGTYKPIERHMLRIKTDEGEIRLYRAKLPHWSRFGVFCR
jgi:hypothetical protein